MEDCMNAEKTEKIAVVGIGALFPGAADYLQYWRNIVESRDLITDVPPSYWLIEDYYDPDPLKKDKVCCKKGGFIPELDFDPARFGLPPKTLSSIDIAQLLALTVAQQVIEDTNSLQKGLIARDKIGVILGSSGPLQLTPALAGQIQHPIWLKVLREQGVSEGQAREICQKITEHYVHWDENCLPGFLNNIVAGRIANRFNFQGINCSVDAACGSSLGAINMAVQELRLGKSDLVIAGGADASMDIFSFFAFDRTKALSHTGDCRPFADDADGTILGEGIGMLALRRLADAVKDNDKIYALIRGIGCSSDGKSKSIYAPSSSGQALAITKAYARLDYNLRDVELIEAHGTGTKIGDRAEFQGLTNALAAMEGVNRKAGCALGSIKSQIGHCKGAAGAAGMIKAVLALHNKVLPPTIKVNKPNARLGIEDSCFYLNTSARPWVHDANSTRKAAVNSFGFGGSNFHITLEEVTGQNGQLKKIRNLPVELFLFSADAVSEIAPKIYTTQRAISEKGFSCIAGDTQRIFAAGATHRLAILARDPDHLSKLCETALEKIKANPEAGFSIPAQIHYHTGQSPAKIAYIFPGQGSQYLNMGCGLAANYDDVRKIWDATAAMDWHGPDRLDRIVFPPPVFAAADLKLNTDTLMMTQWAQPAIGAMSASLLALLHKLELKPDFLMGHSYGEITALYAAGVLKDLHTFMAISRKRGELMAGASACAESAMTAVAATQIQVETIINDNCAQIAIANINSPRQTVIAGKLEDIEKFEKQLAARKLAYKRLPVSAAFHSRLMAAGTRPFTEYLAHISLHSPKFPVSSNVTGKLYPDNPCEIKDILAAQLTSTVRFADQVEHLYREGVSIFIEVGPNAVLSKLIDDCLEGRAHNAIPLNKKEQHELLTLWDALARLSALGIPLAYHKLADDYMAEPRVERAFSPVSLTVRGATIGKPYPPQTGAAGLPGPYADPVCSPEVSPRQAPKKNAGGGDKMPKQQMHNHAWLAAIESLQKSAAEAEQLFQKTLTESHIAFLKSTEEWLIRLASEGAGSTQNLTDIAPGAFEQGVHEIKKDLPPDYAADKHNDSGTEADPEDLDEQPGKSDMSIEQTILQIVSEATGYPAEALNLDMGLEADLGIDSIKRVEIFVELQTRFPQLPDESMTEAASLQTLQEIITYVAATIPQPANNQEPKKKSPAQAVADSTIKRYKLKIVAAPPSQTGLDFTNIDYPLYIVKDEKGIAELLAEKFNHADIPAQVAKAAPPDAKALIYLRALDISQTSSFAECLEINKDVFQTARKCGKNIKDTQGIFVTIQDSGGDFALSGCKNKNPWSAGLSGLVKTLAKEWPNAFVKAIDINCEDKTAGEIAELIFAEIIRGGPETEVAVGACGQRNIIGLAEENKTNRSHLLKDNAVLVVSGGGRGITADCLIGLTAKHKLKLAILGRTRIDNEPEMFPDCLTESELKQAVYDHGQVSGKKFSLPEISGIVDGILAAREVKHTLSRIRENGSDVDYYQVDICDRAKVAETVAHIRQKFGAVNGIIHAAGILADKLIQDKTAAQFEKVFNTKVTGLYNLFAATGADQLTHICCFSSIAARFGNTGQSDYAMANEILNKVCDYEFSVRKGKCLVKSINWGPWVNGMVTPFLRTQFAQAGINLISPAEGVRLFVDELANLDGSAVEVVIGGVQVNHEEM